MENILDLIEEGDKARRFYPMGSIYKRFANFIIDFIGCFLFFLFFSLILIILNLDAVFDFIFLLGEDTRYYRIIEWFWGSIVMIIYYTLSEYFLKGKTLGKLITQTRAVTLDNKTLKFRHAFIRSVFRVVPFEALSYLGSSPTGWHDNWSKTKVIEDQDWIE